MILNRDTAHILKNILPFSMRSAIKYYIIDRIPTKKDQRVINFLTGKKGQNTVLLSGFKKSGNTWVRFVIYNYFNILKNGSDKTLTYLELAALQNHYLEDGSDSEFKEGFPNLYHTHFPYRTPYRCFDHIIYLYRNPLDTLISFYYYTKVKTIPFHGMPSSEKKNFMNIDYFIIHMLPYWIYHYVSSKPKGDIIFCYEKLRDDPLKEFREALEKLGFTVNEDVLKKSIEMSSFDNIKKMGREKNQKYGFGNPDTFIGEFTRSGKSKQYEKELKKETIDKAQAMLDRSGVDMKL